MVVIAALLKHFRVRVVGSVYPVLDTDPVIESMLRRQLITQMPLAVIGTVITVADLFRDGPTLRCEGVVVADTAVRMRPQPGQNGGPRRGANRLCAVGPLKDETFARQSIQVGRGGKGVAVTWQAVGPLLIGPNKK